jgi:hypothetical protein
MKILEDSVCTRGLYRELAQMRFPVGDQFFRPFPKELGEIHASSGLS